MVIVPINVIEVINGEPVIHLAADVANDDWIRAARLLKIGKLEELKELESQQMYQEIEE